MFRLLCFIFGFGVALRPVGRFSPCLVFIADFFVLFLSGNPEMRLGRASEHGDEFNKSLKQIESCLARCLSNHCVGEIDFFL